MTRGKLYQAYDEQFIGDVDYRLHNDSANNWWGELVFTEYRKVSDGDGYLIKLEDGRRGRCSLKKKVNKAVSGIPPLYYHFFRGSGQLE